MKETLYFSNHIILKNTSDDVSLPLLNVTADNLVETKDGITFTITSSIPKDGIEFDPKIGQTDQLTAFFSGSNTAVMKVSCTEKKISNSVNKAAYQLLTFDVLELKWVDWNEELKKANEEEELAPVEVKVMKNLYNSLEKKEWNTTAWLPNYKEPEIFQSLEQKGLLRLKTFGGAYCFTPEGFNRAKRISE